MAPGRADAVPACAHQMAAVPRAAGSSGPLGGRLPGLAGAPAAPQARGGRGGGSPGAVCCRFKELRTQLCRQPQVLKPGGIEVFAMKGKALSARSLSPQVEGLRRGTPAVRNPRSRRQGKPGESGSKKQTDPDVERKLR